MKNETRHYEIQYKTVWEDIWYSSNEAGENRFTSYIKACQKARELLTQDHLEYRVVENVVLTTSEELKRFSPEFPKNF